MPIFAKLREAIYMTIHRKNFKKVSIEVLMENQRLEDVLQFKYNNLADGCKKIQAKLDSNIEFTRKLVDENKALKKKIEAYESNQERWEILDL